MSTVEGLCFTKSFNFTGAQEMPTGLPFTQCFSRFKMPDARDILHKLRNANRGRGYFESRSLEAPNSSTGYGMVKDKNQERYSIQENQPSDWFEPLYAGSNTNGEGVPWANMETHPSFGRWLSQNPLAGDGKLALVVGCGMGDDAIELESLGFQVTAFDVSETAIKLCRERFPHSKVDFVPADLLETQPRWRRKFDFVLEIFTIQALPPKYEKDLIQNISNFVAPDGQILVIAEVGREERSFDNGPPWVLTSRHIDSFASCGLSVVGNYVEQDPSSPGDLGTSVTTFERSNL